MTEAQAMQELKESIAETNKSIQLSLIAIQEAQRQYGWLEKLQQELDRDSRKISPRLNPAVIENIDEEEDPFYGDLL